MCCASLPDRRYDLWKGTGISSVLVEDVARHLPVRVKAMRAPRLSSEIGHTYGLCSVGLRTNVNSLGVDSRAISREGNGHPLLKIGARKK
jgi:hypothetical protein